MRPVVGPAGIGAHRLEHLPGKNNKKCIVCNLPGKGKGTTGALAVIHESTNCVTADLSTFGEM